MTVLTKGHHCLALQHGWPPAVVPSPPIHPPTQAQGAPRLAGVAWCTLSPEALSAFLSPQGDLDSWRMGTVTGPDCGPTDHTRAGQLGPSVLIVKGVNDQKRWQRSQPSVSGLGFSQQDPVPSSLSSAVPRHQDPADWLSCRGSSTSPPPWYAPPAPPAARSSRLVSCSSSTTTGQSRQPTLDPALSVRDRSENRHWENPCIQQEPIGLRVNEKRKQGRLAITMDYWVTIHALASDTCSKSSLLSDTDPKQWKGTFHLMKISLSLQVKNMLSKTFLCSCFWSLCSHLITCLPTCGLGSSHHECPAEGNTQETVYRMKEWIQKFQVC